MSNHPYIGRVFLKSRRDEERILRTVNSGRNYRGEAVISTYYLSSRPVKENGNFSGLECAINMMLIHGTTENWEGSLKEPAGYRKRVSWLKEIKFLRKERSLESAIIKIATPLEFFDKTRIPLAQLRIATQSEPFNAFLGFTARLVDYEFPEKLKKRFPGCVWPHSRIRNYLGVGRDEPIIGTIVKPKWLPCELFAESVTQAAIGGALFIKSDENLHLTKNELRKYVTETRRKLSGNGFDLSWSGKKGKKILFAPHITTNPSEILEHAKIAVDSGANALMFSPHLSGDFEIISRVYEMGNKYGVPIYAHTAGMNRFCGDPRFTCGDDPRVAYLLAALSGAAFMQLPGIGSYIRPADIEKGPIIERLRREGLEGDDGMTLVIAGGLDAKNIGRNIRVLGERGRMFLGGTSVFHHPDGIGAGVSALTLSVRAAHRGVYGLKGLVKYAKSLGEKGYPLLRALQK